jgi:hypothetical protein
MLSMLFHVLKLTKSAPAPPKRTILAKAVPDLKLCYG